MIKCMLCVTSMVALLSTCDCLFPGDSCVADDRAGVCKLVPECEPLVQEIINAGAPMPAHIRRKLQGLSCGFQSLEPLVCCAAPYINDNPPDTVTNYPEFPSGNHGQGGGHFTDYTPSPQSPTPYPWDSNLPSINDNPSRNTRRPSYTDSTATPDARGTGRNWDLLPKNCGQFSDDFKIVGGAQASLSEMPWMVLIAYDSGRGMKLSCGGTLITDRHVLTAAHCVSFLGSTLSLSGVILGEYDIREDPDCETTEGELHCAPGIQNASIEKVIAHPGYSPQNLVDDIALLKLTLSVDFTLENMKPICLPNTPELLADTLEGQMATVAGWGATEDGLQSPVLLKVDLPIIPNNDCQNAYNGSPKIYSGQLCAGGVQDKDSCGGDSGGPLVNTGRVRSGRLAIIQQGIVSYGSKRCGIGGYPGVYTRVSNYMDWILDNIA